ncbi:UvrD-helicase-domain-containing protein [Panus rudis PR-1116 ss-1]|nr:UvrD-helicase-domain-containing protein [Panus rudis PR-1116 ss-1]
MPQLSLEGLNPSQRRAVEHDPNIPLQILAGPGSGKTRVLTMRIAYLISHHKLDPSSICAVTFTNKAANEMRERLTKLVGAIVTSQLRMGTFHALCAMFLRKHAKLIGLDSGFTICDADDSKKIVMKILKEMYEERSQGMPGLPDPEDKNKLGRAAAAPRYLSFISKMKTKGKSPEDCLQEIRTLTENAQKMLKKIGQNEPVVLDQSEIQVYKRYQEALRESNSLDFDDLLIFGVDLFRDNAKVAKWCKHILVDEFQDTNTLQYELMVHIAAASRCITIVGDPDQSIYGWRSAEVKNLHNMKQEYANTKQIMLEHHYRSTGSILAASVAIISQDKKRVAKTLHTLHPDGPRPVLNYSYSGTDEAGFIAVEIKRLVAASGGMLNWNDFAILLRYNSLSRVMESALQKLGIPNRVLAGHKFFERAEIKDLLAYLQIVDNPRFTPAFARAVNTPSRGIGEKSVAELLSRSTALGIPPLDAAERIYDGKIPDIKPSVKRKLASFVVAIRKLRNLAKKGESPSKLIGKLLELIQYEQHLKKTQQDADSRWDNVQELINFAKEFEKSQPSEVPDVPAEDVNEDDPDWDDKAPEFDYRAFEEVASHLVGETPLRLFLQASMLSTDVEEQAEQDHNKVTISTCHTAKGLEWPVVFVPAVEDRTFPSYRAEDDEEERRLLYVACTRAQALLYLSYTYNRMIGGELKTQELSPFVKPLPMHQLFGFQRPEIGRAEREVMAKVLSRPLPSEAEVKRRMDAFNESGVINAWPTPAFPGPSGQQTHSRPNSRSNMNHTQQNLMQQIQPQFNGIPSFTSAKAAIKSEVGLSPLNAPDIKPPLSPSRHPVVNTVSVNIIRANPKPLPSDKGKGKAPTNFSAMAGPSTSTTTATGSKQPQAAHLHSFFGKPRNVPMKSEAKHPVKVKTQSIDLTSGPIDLTSEPIDLTSELEPIDPTSESMPPIPSFTSRTVVRSFNSAATHRSPVVSNAPSTSVNVIPAGASGSASTQRLAGGKRRLGMGHTTGGYPNKKYKPPTL